MADVQRLPECGVMVGLFGSDQPGDALLCLRDVSAYLAQTIGWYQMERSNQLTTNEAAGLGYILMLIERGIQEVYDAI